MQEVFMPISRKLKDYLDEAGVAYTHHIHPTAYTSREIAAVAHIRGKELVKSVILKADDRLVMAVLSANHTADLDALRDAIGSETLKLATEDEFRDAFPTCEVGAMPPFGNLFNLQTFCESTLEQNQEIEFNAGTHRDAIRIAFADFQRLVNPTMVRFAEQYRDYPQRVAS
jgi:Ala-tRNA(Pro) deacylase